MAPQRTGPPPPEEGIRARPPIEEWAALARANAEAFRGWDFSVGGLPFHAVRREAREAAMASARERTARLGLPAAEAGEGPVIMTGHQPEFFHPGVWVKHFLMQRVAREVAGTGVDVVVDTDTAGSVGATLPCRGPEIRRCRQELLTEESPSYYAAVPVPERRYLESFCSATAVSIRTLATPVLDRNFALFADALLSAHPWSSNVGELITGARRRLEGARTDYLELPVSAFAGTQAFHRFAVDIIADAERFAHIHNTELSSYRRRHRVRSAAKPFPDLSVGPSRVEVPFWSLSESGERHPVFAAQREAGVELSVSDETVAVLPDDPGLAARTLAEAGTVLAPRAVTLTMYLRSHVADLFIHGTGGERYDQVTDAIAERWWGVRLPPIAVATLTLRLPLEAPVVDDEQVAAVAARLHRLTHNPDAALGQVDFETLDAKRRALRLAEEKRALVDGLREPGADRASLGARLKEVNRELQVFVTPLIDAVARERDVLERSRAEAEVLTDRTYPFFLWSPDAVADVVRSSSG